MDCDPVQSSVRRRATFARYLSVFVFFAFEIVLNSLASRSRVLNLGSRNPFGVHECVSGVRIPKSNQENPLVFIRQLGTLFSLIAPQLYSDMFLLQVD